MAKISHMVLPVTDLDKSRDWYVNKLAFQLDREHPGVVGIKEESGLIIFLQKVEGSLAGQKITLTIRVEDVEAKHEQLVAAGVKFEKSPQLLFWGYGAEVLDPDGYTNHLWGEVTMRKAMK